jgi:uncharacterized protein YdeI (YjbR/CyaY-like superfamily)
MNPKLDSFFAKQKRWHDEFEQLRTIVLSCGLSEEFKWGNACYTHEGNNIVLIHGFKDYCALLLFKGSLLKDPRQILIQQTKNVQAARQIRFTDVDEIVKLASTLKAYIKEAIKVEKAGVKVEFKKTAEFTMVPEFKSILGENAKLKSAFNALTPGRQRGYLLYFSAAKQSKTRESRIEKSIEGILKGKGLND